MGILLYIVTLILVLFSYIILRYYSFVSHAYKLKKKLGSLIAHEEAHWFAGHLHLHPGMVQEALEQGIKWTKKYPKMYLYFVGPLRSIVILHHPDTVRKLTNTAEPKQMKDGAGYAFLLPWIGDGLLLSSGRKWKRNRKLLTPGFHFDVLKPYVDIYNDCLDILIEKFRTQSAVSGKSIDICEPVGLCALDVILRCAFSTELHVQENQNENYVKNVNTLTAQIVRRALSPWLYPDFVYYTTSEGTKFKDNCKFSHEFVSKIIETRKTKMNGYAMNGYSQNSNIKQNGVTSKKTDFLDILLLARDEHDNSLSSKEILDEAETFMFEGHDTTTSGLSWILYNLARHPKILAKAQLEVDDLLSCRPDGRPQWKDLSCLPYLTQCIKESLRLHPPVHFFSRTLSKPLEIEGKLLPVDTNIDVNVYNLHHNPAVWKDPMKYDPDRFLPENVKIQDPHAFLPFSAGPRNCIGQVFALNEMKTTIARLIRNFDISLDTSREVRMVPDVVLRAERGIYLHFKER